ncbi:hypothetical protein GCM10022631_17340 [Deinococcus rubellus]
MGTRDPQQLGRFLGTEFGLDGQQLNCVALGDFAQQPLHQITDAAREVFKAHIRMGIPCQPGQCGSGQLPILFAGEMDHKRLRHVHRILRLNETNEKHLTRQVSSNQALHPRGRLLTLSPDKPGCQTELLTINVKNAVSLLPVSEGQAGGKEVWQSESGRWGEFNGTPSPGILKWRTLPVQRPGRHEIHRPDLCCIAHPSPPK